MASQTREAIGAKYETALKSEYKRATLGYISVVEGFTMPEVKLFACAGSSVFNIPAIALLNNAVEAERAKAKK